MRCNWFTNARILIPGYPNATRFPGVFRGATRAIHATRATRATQCATRSIDAPLTEAQMSRAAAQAIRLSVRNAEPANAYYILNSLRFPIWRKKYPTNDKMPGLNCLAALFVPLHFPRIVSPRLSGHALIHSLIRIGASEKAGHLAGVLLQNNIRIRERTLDAIFHALIVNPDTARRMRLERSWIKDQQLEVYWPLHRLPSLPREKNTRQAVELLLHLRRYRYRRTESMYQNLIHACLLQGEIFVGSLLFVLVVKDWQARKSRALRMNTPPEDGHIPQNITPDLETELHGTPFPSATTMCAILDPIDEMLSLEGDSQEFDWQIQAALQSLANLASLLDTHSLPFSNIAPLIRTMYRCPRVHNDVWVLVINAHNALMPIDTFMMS